MNELRFQRRRAHIWWLTLIMRIQYAFLAHTLLTAIRNTPIRYTQRWPSGSGIRIFIPLLALAGKNRPIPIHYRHQPHNTPS